MTWANTSSILPTPLKIAVATGNYEVTEEILSSTPNVVSIGNEPQPTIFHLAIGNRQENIINLMHQYGEFGHILLSAKDKGNNCGLHFAGYLDSRVKLNLRAMAVGAALQMQRELLWFKELNPIPFF
ncbi:unnamed protein product [Ilex paraguariensis]|uniref:Uncharacterized protein n=1 Tax=Ilex paraguariensis TaxID=185542 RepID=A0ABC8UP11_9AQUA